jgi:hypothetical protein
MTATIGSTPFELVDEPSAHAPAYEGMERRRSRPRVAVCDRLAEARQAVWATTFLRILLIVGLWIVVVAPHLMAPDLVVARTGVPLAYVCAELVGLALVLRHQARLARAATLY